MAAKFPLLSSSLLPQHVVGSVFSFPKSLGELSSPFGPALRRSPASISPAATDCTSVTGLFRWGGTPEGLCTLCQPGWRGARSGCSGLASQALAACRDGESPDFGALLLFFPTLQEFFPYLTKISSAATCALALGLCRAPWGRVWLLPLPICCFGHMAWTPHTESQDSWG